MKKLFLMMALFCNSVILSAVTITTWQGSNVANVIDLDVIWKKFVVLPVGTTTIHAVTRDITIYLPHDVVFVANDNGASTLELIADTGHTITIIGDEDFELRTSRINDNDANMIWSGAGQIIWRGISS